MKNDQVPSPVPQGKPISPVVRASLDRLAPLVGIWTGKGEGGYPTIDDFEYTETLQIQHQPGLGYLTYEQKTELVDAAGRVVRRSHWEAGLLRPLEDGSLELACVQAGGRVEVLRGEFVNIESKPGWLKLEFQSKLVGNDERMKSSSREWTITTDRFKYVMEMVTTKVAEPTIHLEANLMRFMLSD